MILRPATLSKIRFTKFYASPLVKFLLDAVSHGCLLVLYTVCVLADFRLPLMDIEIVLLGDRMMDLTREVIGDFQDKKFLFPLDDGDGCEALLEPRDCEAFRQQNAANQSHGGPERD